MSKQIYIFYTTFSLIFHLFFTNYNRILSFSHIFDRLTLLSTVMNIFSFIVQNNYELRFKGEEYVEFKTSQVVKINDKELRLRSKQLRLRFNAKEV